MTNPARMAEFTARCFDRAMDEMGPTQLNIPRDYFYGQIKAEIPQPRRLDRGPGGEQSLNEAAELLAQARFPVIISGGGVVMGDAVAECRARRAPWARRWSTATCTTIPSPPAIRCGAARWATGAPRQR